MRFLTVLATLVGRFVDHGAPPGPSASPDEETVEAIIAGRGLDTVFQPIVDLRTGEVVVGEALARFRDGASPAFWFAAADRAGRDIIKLDISLTQNVEDDPAQSALAGDDEVLRRACQRHPRR